MKQDLLRVCGDVNPPGIEITVFFVPISDIDTWPAFKTSTGAGDTITLDGDIDLKANKTFFQFQMTTDTGLVKDTQVGGSSKSFESMLEGFVPRTGAAQLEWARDMANACGVFIAKDANGVMRVLGTPGRPAKAESQEISTGAAASDESGNQFSFKSSQGSPAPVYEGVIDLDPTT